MKYLYFIFIYIINLSTSNCYYNFNFDPYDLESLQDMARISEDAYYEDRGECSFGWNNSSIRGDVYINDKKELLVAFKGTDLFGKTSELDKYNNNLLFSCCCANINSNWKPVCDCYNYSLEICHTDCLKREWWYNEYSYLYHAPRIISRILEIFPYPKKLYFTGHSLGGALASWMSMYFQYNFETGAIVFSVPGTAGLIFKSLNKHVVINNIWSLGSNRDPVFTGNCDSFGSACYHMGYAIETSCLLGYRGFIDGDSIDNILQHRIKWVRNNLNAIPFYRYENSEKCLLNECNKIYLE